MNREKYYRISLLDYSTPSFVTFSKAYYGTMENIRRFREREKSTEEFSSLDNALAAAVGGDFSVYNPDLYWDEVLVTPVTVIGMAQTTLQNYAWTHYNIWGYPTEMQCDSVETEHLWIIGGDKYLRAMFAQFEGLQSETTMGLFAPISLIWGHPGIIDIEYPRRCTNTLAVVEKRFGSELELEADMNQFSSTRDIEFSGFCNDIMGNG